MGPQRKFPALPRVRSLPSRLESLWLEDVMVLLRSILTSADNLHSLLEVQV